MSPEGAHEGVEDREVDVLEAGEDPAEMRGGRERGSCTTLVHAGVGRGVAWEGLLAVQLLHDNGAQRGANRFVALVFDDHDRDAAVPLPLHTLRRLPMAVVGADVPLAAGLPADSAPQH